MKTIKVCLGCDYTREVGKSFFWQTPKIEDCICPNCATKFYKARAKIEAKFHRKPRKELM